MAKTKPKKTTPKKPEHTHEFEIKILWDNFHSEYKKVLEDAQKTIEIKGFRKGKAPLKAVEKNLDISKIHSRVLERLLPQSYLEYIKENNLKTASDPQIRPVSTDLGKDWVFMAQVAKIPSVSLGEYQKYIKTALKVVKPQKTKKTSEKESGDNPKFTALIDSLIKNAKVKISQLQVDQEASRSLDQLASQLNQMKVSVEDYLKSIKKSQEKLVEEYQQVALDRLKIHYIMEELVKIEKPKVTEKEIKETNKNNEDPKFIKSMLERQKVIDKLLEL